MDLNRNPIIFLKDVKYSELKALVQYMYRGEVNISQDELPSLLSVAQSLKIRGLADVETSSNNMSSDTLILPDLNKARTGPKPTGIPASSAPIPAPAPQHQPTVQMGFQQQSHPHISAISQVQSIPNVNVPIVQLGSGPSSSPSTAVPPPAKRSRVHHQQQQQQQHSIDPVAVTIQPQTSSVQAHSLPSQMYDPLPTPSTSHYDPQPPDQHQAHFSDDGMVEQTEMYQTDEVAL